MNDYYTIFQNIKCAVGQPEKADQHLINILTIINFFNLFVLLTKVGGGGES